MSDTHLFISHSATDKELVGALVTLLQTGLSVPAKRIFCTSLEGMGVQAGRDFRQYIKDKLQRPALVVSVVTPAYYESAFCLCELGATWAMSHEAFPLIVPPITYDDLRAVLGGVQVGKIDVGTDLDALKDAVEKALELERQPTPRWSAQRDTFLKVQLPKFLKKLAKPTKIDAATYNDLHEKYEASLHQAGELQDRIGVLTEQLDKVSALKSRTEVAKVRADYEDETDAFEKLVTDAKVALKNISNIVREALFESMNGGILTIEGLDDRRDEASTAVKNHFLKDNLSPNYADPKVKRADEHLGALQAFLEKASADFHEAFVADNDMQADMANRRFWTSYLGLR